MNEQKKGVGLITEAESGVPRQDPHQHDKGYRQLLANKKTFLQLIKSFVKEPWVENINEEALVKLDRSFVLKDFTDKEADIVYRLKTNDKDIFFYILLELQSSVDFLMPFRLLVYMVQLWLHVYQNTDKDERVRKDYRLPVIIPAVLYNGANNWTAPLSFKEMLADHKSFEKHLVDFRYILFDVNRYQKDELLQMANLISSILLLDQKISKEEIISRLWLMIDTIKKMSPDEFQQLKTWLINVLLPRVPEQQQREVEQILKEGNPQEVVQMILNLEVTLDEMQQQAEARGEARGEAKGAERKQIEIARAALREGFGIEAIAKITGLTKEQVEKLKQAMN
ncbi:MAG: Rpn family recombination-promoting nuclease/putative transposase [Bacillota bacterium]